MVSESEVDEEFIYGELFSVNEQLKNLRNGSSRKYLDLISQKRELEALVNQLQYSESSESSSSIIDALRE